MRSAIYEGELVHRRMAPEHAFRVRLALPLLFLDEIEDVVDAHPLWSAERANAVSFRRADFLGDPSVPLDVSVRDLVEERVGVRPSGPVAQLAHVRTWGWLFNPIAFYYCFDPSGHRVEHAVALVTNTPWRERHAYVLGGPGTHEVDKALHVSPFFGMDQRYRIAYDEPGSQLGLTIGVTEGGARVFHAGLRLERREIDRAALGRLLWRYPMLTMRVSAGIHANAARLWRKGATFHRHPSKGSQEVTSARTDDHPNRTRPAA